MHHGAQQGPSSVTRPILKEVYKAEWIEIEKEVEKIIEVPVEKPVYVPVTYVPDVWEYIKILWKRFRG